MDSSLLFQKEKTGMDILKNCRNELYRSYPFLDGAFASVSYCASPQTDSIGTDGRAFFFCPDFLLKACLRSPASLRRGYLHMLLHCLYLHILPDPTCDPGLWNLACDLAVEEILREVKTPRSAEQIYELLKNGALSDTLEALSDSCAFDDHRLWWKQKTSEEAYGLRRKWDRLRLHASQGHGGFSQNAGTARGTATEDLPGISRSPYDYRRFLRRFAVPREEAVLDTESFDYIAYTYGMEHYGNLPFVEPLEYKEGNKLEELVIAIDTSGSCSVSMVQQFLSETYAILEEKENFFRKMKVYILQCDCCIQEEVLIRSEEDWKAYCKQVKIQGRAGTDFRPVFRRIEELKANLELKNLKALIYFTDGDGIFPIQKPDYETAFVFLTKTKAMDYLPPWALCLVTNTASGKDLTL